MSVTLSQGVFAIYCGAVRNGDEKGVEDARAALSQMGVEFADETRLFLSWRRVTPDVVKRFNELESHLNAGNERGVQRCLHVLQQHYGFRLSVDAEKFREKNVTV